MTIKLLVKHIERLKIIQISLLLLWLNLNFVDIYKLYIKKKNFI